jgi:uncharacterized protein YhdP
VGETPRQPAAGPGALSAAATAARPSRSYLRLTLLALGGAGLLLGTLLMAYELARARVPQHRAALEDLIRHETGLEVRFSELSVRWGWYGPEAVFHDVELGEPGRRASLLRAPRLIVSLDTWRMARSGHVQAGRITLVNPDIDLTAAEEDGALQAEAGAGAARADPLALGKRILAHWSHGQIDIAGGTLRVPPAAGAPVTVSLRYVQLRRLATGWSADVVALLPESLGADLHLTLQLQGNPAWPELSDGSVRLSAERLAFAGWRGLVNDPRLGRYLPLAGSGNLELRADLVRGQLSTVGGRLRAQALAWSAVDGAAGSLALGHLGGEWQLARRRGQWHLNVDRLELGTAALTPASLMLDTAGDGTAAHGRVQHLPLAALATLARWYAPGLPPAALTLGGEARTLTFDWSAHPAAGARLVTSADLDDLTLATPSGALVLSGLAAHVAGADDSAVVDLEGHGVRAQLAGQERAALDQLEVGGRLHVRATPAGWQLSTAELLARRGDASLSASGSIGLDAGGAAPRIDTRVTLRAADIALLAGLLTPQARELLGAAVRLNAGTVQSADFSWRGRLDGEPPWMSSDAQFTGAVALREARLAAQDDWPAADEIAARIAWRGSRFHAAIDHARSGSFELSDGSADWDARGAHPLRFGGRLRGDAQQALGWLRSHPQLASWAPGIAGIDLRGETLLDLDVTQPLAAQAGTAPAPRARLAVLLDGAELRPVAGLPPLDGLRGTLAFAGGRLQHSTLTGQWLGGPVSLGVAEHREHGVMALAISGRGFMDARRAVQAAGGDADDVPLSGSAEWSALLAFQPGADAQQPQWQLRADSSLVGVASQLPEPFAKSAGAALPLHVELQAGADAGQLHVSLGERLRAVAGLERRGDSWRIERGAVRLSPSAPALPAERVLLLDGHVSRLDLPAALALCRQAGGDAALPALRARLSVAQLGAGTRSYAEVSVLAEAGGGGSLRLESHELAGTARWAAVIGPQQPAVVHLGSLNLTQPADLALAGALASALAPSVLLGVDELDWRGHPLGSLSGTLNARPDGGLEVSGLRLSGASGDSHASASCQGASCRLQFSLDSRDAAATLAAFGLRPDVSARSARVEAEARWSLRAAAPLATLGGHLHMQIEDGTVHIGAAEGEPFALLSVPALLAGTRAEASDAQPAELHFARLTAEYELRDGEAVTPDLHFDGDAEILMRGRVGLAAGDYDEQAWILRGEERLPAAVRRLGPTPRMAAAWLSLRELLMGAAADRTPAALHLRGTWNDPIVSPAE